MIWCPGPDAASARGSRPNSPLSRIPDRHNSYRAHLGIMRSNPVGQAHHLGRHTRLPGPKLRPAGGGRMFPSLRLSSAVRAKATSQLWTVQAAPNAHSRRWRRLRHTQKSCLKLSAGIGCIPAAASDSAWQYRRSKADRRRPATCSAAGPSLLATISHDL